MQCKTLNLQICAKQVLHPFVIFLEETGKYGVPYKFLCQPQISLKPHRLLDIEIIY